jgi:general L-amino acid transport system substrate-binding protein
MNIRFSMHDVARRIGSAARVTSFAAMAAGLVAVAPAGAQTLDAVKQRGALICGSHLGLPGFGVPDAQGAWRGLDVDFCRALAAGILGDAQKVRFIPLSGKDRFTALQSKEVDVLSRNATYTLSRDTQLGLNWAAITFFDGQGFMVKKSLGIDTVKKLDGASVCVGQGTTTELNLADFFRANKMRLETVAFATTEEASKAMEAGRCDAFTTDRSGLAGERLKFAKADDFVILPETISKEPLGPAVRHGDEQWTDIVRWTHYLMLNAEEFGVKKANVDEMMKSPNPEIRRLLGIEGQFGEMLGLPKDWGYQIIRQVGNYGESYEANLGAGSRLGIARGANALYVNGGLQYSYPVR